MNSTGRLHRCPKCQMRLTIYDVCSFCRVQEAPLSSIRKALLEIADRDMHDPAKCKTLGHIWRDVGLNIDVCSRCGQERMNFSERVDEDNI